MDNLHKRTAEAMLNIFDRHFPVMLSAIKMLHDKGKTPNEIEQYFLDELKATKEIANNAALIAEYLDAEKKKHK